MKTHIRLTMVALLIGAGVICVSSAARADEHQKAVAVLHATQGNKAAGTVTFTKTDDGVRVVAEITGLKPNGKHGFHVHEFGDCSDPKAENAGGHFNPGDHQHGGPTADERHAGDMGNLDADAKGNARLEYVDKMMKLSGDNAIIGHAVIVHEKADDLKSQPTGDAGARIACGVIGVAKQ
jgi:superoxide dismutase, Cu-Zn family